MDHEAADSMQARGGKARAAALSPERRSEIASAAASMRWQARHVGHRRIARAT
jgi:hypothetical protein